jgi:hypothetical protein
VSEKRIAHCGRLWPLALVGLVALFVVATLASSQFSLLKMERGAYHSRDYGFYREFYSRALDSSMRQSYSLNPEGSNFLRYRGMEGSSSSLSLQKSIHLEPIKYLHALVYRASGVRAVHAFVAVLYFLPLLGMARLAVRAPRGEAKFWLILGLLYCLLPPNLAAVSFDLRPFSLLVPMFWICLMTILARAPGWLVVASFLLLLAVREEALILTIGLVFIARAWGVRWRESRGRPVWPSLLAIWLLWGIITPLYFRWSGLQTTLPVDVTRILAKISTPNGFVGAALLVVALIAALIVWRRTSSRAKTVCVLLALAAVAALPQFLSLFAAPSQQTLADIVYAPRSALAWGIALTAVLPLIMGSRTAIRAQKGFAALACVAVVLAGLSLTSWEGSAVASVKQLLATDHSSADIRAFRDQLPKHESRVLCDYRLYQTFASLDSVFVFQRLPNWLVAGERRRYPANLEVLEWLLRKHVDYVAVADSSLIELAPVLARSGVEVEPVLRKGSVAVLRIVDRAM